MSFASLRGEDFVEVLTVKNPDERWGNPIWQGWLHKFTVTLGKVCWRKRFFILNEDGALWYFKSEKAGAKPCKGNVNIAGYHFRISNVRKNCIEIERYSKPFLFYSDKDKKMKVLVDRLKRAGGIEDQREVWYEKEDIQYGTVHAEKLSTYRRKYIADFMKKILTIRNLPVPKTESELKNAYLEYIRNEKRVKIDPTQFRIPFSKVTIIGKKYSSEDQSTALFEVEYEGKKCLLKLYDTEDFYKRNRVSSYRNELNISKYKHKYFLKHVGETIVTDMDRMLLEKTKPGLISPSKLPQIGVLYEYCDPSNKLREHLRKKKKLSIEAKLKILVQLTEVLSHLNVFDWIHGELCWDNVIFNVEDNTPFLVNFGRSEKIDPETGHVVDIKHKLHARTPNTKKRLFKDRVMDGMKDSFNRYMSPEFISLKPYGAPHEVYSFGIMMYEILTGDFSWTRHLKVMKLQGYKPYDILEDVVKKPDIARPRVEEAFKKSRIDLEEYYWLKNLMERCWDKDPKRRPTWSKIKEGILGEGEGFEDSSDDEEEEGESSSDDDDDDDEREEGDESSSDDDDDDDEEGEDDESSSDDDDDDDGDVKFEEIERLKKREMELIYKVASMKQEMEGLKSQVSSLKKNEEESKKMIESQEKKIEELETKLKEKDGPTDFSGF